MRIAIIVTVLLLAGCEKPEPATGPLLPSIAAIQQQLNRMEPENPLKADGKLGRQTQEKWDRLFCEQSAKRAWDEFEGKKP